MKTIDFFWKLFELNDGSVSVHCDTESDLIDFFEDAKKHGYDYCFFSELIPTEHFKEIAFVNKGISITPLLCAPNGFLSCFDWKSLKGIANNEMSDSVALDYLRERKGE